MKGLLVLTLVAALITDPLKINQINRAKQEARKAYTEGDYETAIQKYRYLTDSLQVSEDEVLLNLGHSYYQAGDVENATTQYQTLVQSNKPSVRSAAWQQLGVIKNKQGKAEEALSHFKEAIKADPSNEDARYNYELLKRKLDEKKKQEEQQKNQEQQNKEQQQDKKEQEKKDQEKKDQEKKDQEKKDSDKSEQEKKEQQEQQQNEDQKNDEEKKENQPSSQKLEQMKISEEKAKMILEAMKNQEIQYLQQNKRKATQPKDKGKPDW